MDTITNNSFFLLQFFGASFPVGGFQHSNGLEEFIAKEVVFDEDSLAKYIRNLFENNYLSMEGRAFCKAYKLISEGKRIDEIIDLDQKFTAMKLTKESRNASLKTGRALLKNAAVISNMNLAKEYLKIVQEDRTIGNYSIVAGTISAEAGMRLHTALKAYYFNECNNLIQVAIKLIPLGQSSGQRVLFKKYEFLEKIADRTVELADEQLSNFTPLMSIFSMKHEELYSRLYMS